MSPISEIGKERLCACDELLKVTQQPGQLVTKTLSHPEHLLKGLCGRARRLAHGQWACKLST